MATYADTLKAAGQIADATIASITQQPALTVHADAGFALGTQWDKDVAAAQPPLPPPPPPSSKTIMGSAKGAWSSISVMCGVLGIKPGNIVRAFNQTDAKAVPAGVSCLFSDDGGLGRGYDLDGATTGSAGYTKWLGTLKAVFRDDAPHFWCCGHEEDIHGSDAVRLGRVYDGMQVVLAQFNAGRKYPVRTAVVTTGMPYDDSTANGYKKWGLKSADVICMDNYSRKHWTTIDAFAKSLGKPWGIGENGVQAGSPATALSDTAILTAMQSDFAQALGKALFFCYWPNSHQNLVTPGAPKSVAFLKQTIAATLVP